MAVNPPAVWLISGCSSGFGRDLVLAALSQGYRVIATARKIETIRELQEKGAAVLPLDVTANPEELNAFATAALAI